MKSHEIIDLYESEYRHRLRARPILQELQDTDNIQNQLFNLRLQAASRKTTDPWTISELDRVLSSLKTGKARDPSGLICDIFKKPICGDDLRLSMLTLLNRTKETL